MKLFFSLLICSFFLFAFVPAKKMNVVSIKTKYGIITLKLYNETPKHRDNFMKLVNEGFYDSLLFHRVIKNFMIQGGDPDSKHAAPGVALGNGDVGYTVPAEISSSIFHKRGVLAAARDENPEKASSGCQFYIVQGKVFTDAELNAYESKMGKKIPDEQREVYKTVGGTPWLDGSYTVYGEVIDGMSVVDSIANVPVDGMARPLTDVRIIEVRKGKPVKR